MIPLSPEARDKANALVTASFFEEEGTDALILELANSSLGDAQVLCGVLVIASAAIECLADGSGRTGADVWAGIMLSVAANGGEWGAHADDEDAALTWDEFLRTLDNGEA